MRDFKVIILLAGLVISTNGISQQFIYKAGFFGFFDNREYFNPYINDQTIFGTRISGEAGYDFNADNRIMAGINYLYEFGSKGEGIAPDFTAYYHGQRENAGIYLGAFPRYELVSMPFALMSDTICYYRPNVEGILLEYHRNGLYQNVWIDWTGRQSFEKKEMFLLGFSGFIKKGIFISQHHFVMTHLAHSKKHVDEHIRDNAGFTVMPGLDLAEIISIDTLTINAGVLASYDRLRGVYDFRFPVGFISELNAGYKGFGLKATFYAGDNQMITSGDGFYKSDIYGRIDFFYRLTNSSISSKIQVSTHFVPG